MDVYAKVPGRLADWADSGARFGGEIEGGGIFLAFSDPPSEVGCAIENDLVAISWEEILGPENVPYPLAPKRGVCRAFEQFILAEYVRPLDEIVYDLSFQKSVVGAIPIEGHRILVEIGAEVEIVDSVRVVDMICRAVRLDAWTIRKGRTFHHVPELAHA